MDVEAQLNDPLFRALFEQTEDAVLLATSGRMRILDANPMARRLMQWSTEDLGTQSLTDLATPEEGKVFNTFLNEGLDSGTGRTLTTRIQGGSGESIPCEVAMRTLPMPGERLILFTFRDLTERLQALEDIELRNIAIANVTSGVTIADARQPDLPLIYVNQGFLNITGYTAREAVGRSCRFLQGRDRDQPALEELRAALSEERPCVVQLRNYRKDGGLFFNELHISPVRNEEGELTHFVGIQLDVTEKVKARESLELSEKRYREALQREQELNEIKTRFISMVSHEFRTPMTGIQASAALVRRFGEKLGLEKRDRHLLNIETSLKRMNRLLDDVLFFSRAEAHKLTVQLKELNLHEYFRRLTENLAPIYPGRKVMLHGDLPQEEAYLLDEHLMDHIFHNLISNAIKYSDQSVPVMCRYWKDGGLLHFTVEDEGIGIPPKDQEKLFDAFHRAGNVGARRGTGLGLNIALRAIELLQGRISFKSEIGRGSTFRVTIPANSKSQSTTS
jgi:PAS domain S-box-containing protein